MKIRVFLARFIAFIVINTFINFIIARDIDKTKTRFL